MSSTTTCHCGPSWWITASLLQMWPAGANCKVRNESPGCKGSCKPALRVCSWLLGRSRNQLLFQSHQSPGTCASAEASLLLGLRPPQACLGVHDSACWWQRQPDLRGSGCSEPSCGGGCSSWGVTPCRLADCNKMACNCLFHPSPQLGPLISPADAAYLCTLHMDAEN